MKDVSVTVVITGVHITPNLYRFTWLNDTWQLDMRGIKTRDKVLTSCSFKSNTIQMILSSVLTA